MSRIKVLACVLLAAAVCSAAPNRIVGGSPTTIEEYPSIIQVEFLQPFWNTWNQQCAATVLNTRYVLSAGHCFDGWVFQRRYRRFRVGATYRDSGGELHDMDEEFVHPSYGLLGEDGDIAVVRLLTAMVYSSVLQPGFIPVQGFELPDNTSVVHAGWGASIPFGPRAEELQEVTVYTINTELCRERYSTLQPQPQPVTQNMICAGILDVGGRDACHGDSGGPLYYNSEGRNILVGIVSWGQGCAHEHYPGVSTKVSPYTNWIVATAA